jgi:hypothetical protein
METMERKKSRTRWSFTPEFKAEIVERVKRGDRSIGQVARDFDLGEWPSSPSLPPLPNCEHQQGVFPERWG